MPEIDKSRQLPISIIIPTLNEEDFLPRLLKSINNQRYGPLEVIVADAQSKDKTRENAQSLGAKIVEGGILTVGRNNGAKAASGDVLFFLDADTVLPDDMFLKRAYDLWTESKADVGSTLFSLDQESRTSVSASIVFSFYFLLKIISANLRRPFLESGFFQIASKDAFESVGGFRDMPPGVPEDLDLMLRAIRAGLKYRVIPCKIHTSGRRYKNVGQSIRSIIGTLIGGITVKRNLLQNDKLLAATTTLYGKLGGETNKDNANEKENEDLTQNRPAFFLGKNNTLKLAITAGIIGTASLIGTGLIIATKMKKKDKKTGSNKLPKNN
ncbi:glycosyltransferase [Candidatus Dojkabacteria bacterium]|nr:glycosyltransferase [Candidatus Dojkabacteria bacterium]